MVCSLTPPRDIAERSGDYFRPRGSMRLPNNSTRHDCRISGWSCTRFGWAFLAVLTVARPFPRETEAASYAGRWDRRAGAFFKVSLVVVLGHGFCVTPGTGEKARRSRRPSSTQPVSGSQAGGWTGRISEGRGGGSAEWEDVQTSTFPHDPH